LLVIEVEVCCLARWRGLEIEVGTPDFVGTCKKLPGNVIEFPIEIVSAEIKIDPQAPVVASGQAIVHRLFSTKTYFKSFR